MNERKDRPVRKVLILCAHRPERSPSQRYRFEQYLPFLRENGFEFTFSPLLNKNNDEVFYQHGRILKKMAVMAGTVLQRFRDLRTFQTYDIIFIQREASFFGTSYFEKKAFQSGAKVIFDFDDSIWLADTSPGNKKWEWLKKPKKFFANLRYAHLVIAGNDYLADKAKELNLNTIVIPTTVDTGIHIPKPQLRGKDIIVIGWSGSISTLKHFNSLKPVLKKLKIKYGAKIQFKLIADKVFKDEDLDLEVVAWSEKSEVNELNSFDIGIMPLPDDEWTMGKCGLKGLTYMACEVPTVMSAVGANNKIISHEKNGFLAAGEKEWMACLERLINDPVLRKELGKNGRETVIEKFSVEANKDKYLRAFAGF